MSRLHRIMLASVACVSIAACSDQLAVENPNSPDQERALARPTDVEALISGSFNTVHRNTLGSTNLSAPMDALGLANYSNLANFGMGTRSTIPRPPIDNSRNNPTAGENYGPFLGLHRAARAAALGLSRVNQTTFTFFPFSAQQTARARAFAHFTIGVALGNVALSYDSGSAINPNDDPLSNTPIPLIDYNALMAYALAELDSAIAIAPAFAAAGGTGPVTLPAAWMATPTTLTSAQFVALSRGYKARFRAGVARNPTERAAVTWASVIADAGAFTAVFPTDLNQALLPASGWSSGWNASQMYASASVNWHQIWGFVVIMGAPQVDADFWLSTSVANRIPFTSISPDLRWPQGATRAAQQADAGARYFQNRASGNDWFGDASGNSQYRHIRFFPLFTANLIGTFPLIQTAEMNLLAAEGHIYAGTFATAAALIDLTRIARGGLPGLVAGGIVNNTTPVPGGATCVPRIPVGPSFTTTACGNMLEALKWEKRMETSYAGWGHWFFDGRGWGDLPQGTAPHWSVPYQEQDTRRNTAFAASVGPATPGTYGF